MENQTKGSKRNPLGYIQLDTGEKPVAVMNDVFLNFQFGKEYYWENLRSIANIFVNDYAGMNPKTVAKPILGSIKVETQYKFFLDTHNTTRNQDIKVTWEDITFIEFQNRIDDSRRPIEIRSPEYFGLGIGHSKGKLAHQIWLLSDDLDTLLLGKKYANYVLYDEMTKMMHPKPSGMMFVSLSRVAEEDSPAGELATFLLGKTIDLEAISDIEVKGIARGFKACFEDFKEDKEVKSIMTVKERFMNDGRIEGREEGREEGRFEERIQSAIRLINKKGFTWQEAADTLELTIDQITQLKETIGKTSA